MKKKNILLGIVSFFILFILTGCGNKTVLTTDKFKSIVTEHDLVATDITNQYEKYDYIQEVTIAKSTDGWQLEYYVISDESYATSMFNNNKSTFESSKGNTSSESSADIGNYSSYTLTTGDKYMHICRVDNTILYVSVDKTYKDTVSDIVKELGY